MENLNQLNRRDGVASSVQEERDHLKVAQEQYPGGYFCYTHVTVESLLDKIDELTKLLNERETR